MTIQEVCATIEQQTACIHELKEENKQLEARVAELTPFRSDFQGLQDRFWALKTSESSLSQRVTLLTDELKAAMQIVQSRADESKQNQTALDRAEQNFRNLQLAVAKDVSSNFLKGVVSNAASIVAKKTAAAVASTQTEALVSAAAVETQTEAEVSAASDLDKLASDLDKLASDLEKTRGVASFQTKILDLNTEILALTTLNAALTTEVKSLQVDLDGARQALATQPEESAAAVASTQPEASASGTKRALFAAGVAVLAAGALAVAKNPEAAKDAADKGCAFVAKTASSVASFLAKKGRFGLDFLRNLKNIKAVEIDLTKMLN
jgi:chromosome segregation ATPase